MKDTKSMRIKNYEDEWRWMKMNEDEWRWMKMNEDEWRWMKMNEDFKASKTIVAKNKCW